jgi:polyisoprenoid-binding protein YceI
MCLVTAVVVMAGVARAGAAEVPLDVTTSTLKFTGHAFLHDFHGTAQVDPALTVPVQGAVIEIAAGKMTTFIDARDRNMRTWLKVDANPAIKFELTSVRLVQGDAAHATKEHPATFAVAGTFTLNQTPKPLTATATGWREGNRLVIDGTTVIDTTAYGLPIVQTLFLTVDKNVDVAFHLEYALP